MYRYLEPWMTDDLTASYYNIHSNNDLILHYYMSVHHADLYLKSISNNYYHITCKHHNFFNIPKPEWLTFDYLDIDMWIFPNDLGLDKNHPGLRNNFVTASLIYDYILEKQKK